MNPKFVINEEGQKIGVFLDIKEYNAVIEELEDFHDIMKAETRLKKNEEQASADYLS